MMTVRVSISLTTWPKRLVDSVGVLMLEVFMTVFYKVVQSLCRSGRQPTLRALRSNRDAYFFRAAPVSSRQRAAAYIPDRLDNGLGIVALNEMPAGRSETLHGSRRQR